MLTPTNRKFAGLVGTLGNAFKDPWAQVRYLLKIKIMGHARLNL